ncbi:UNVERIFIED_CONTAM: hypothetical protein RMT77_004718 [Armadillidium vulgare]
MFVKGQVMIFTLACLQFLENAKTVSGSTEVETYCKDLCAVRIGQTRPPTPEEIEICEKRCFIRVEVADFARRISNLHLGNDTIANVLLAPFSLVALLNLLMLGTSGPANLEIKNAISYSDNLTENFIHEDFKNILSILNGKSRGVELHFHTGLFFQNGIFILDSFKETAEGSYLSEITFLDYQSSPNSAKESINTWVSTRSEGRITDIISNPLSPDTKCIGVSFITFKSSWAFEFNSSLTENGIFNTGTKTINITMMTTLMKVLYFKNENMGFEIISLPFIMNSYAIYILQPVDINQLQSIENSLGPIMLNATLSQMKSKDMKVTIPKMKLEFKHSLKKDLNSFGVNKIFSPGADFTRLTTDPEIIINDLYHACALEVTEAGINTNIVAGEHVTNEEGNFHLNKPSLLFIKDKENDYEILWGKIIDPQPLP